MDAALVTTNRYAREALNRLLSDPGQWEYEEEVNPKNLKTIRDALERWDAAGVIERQGTGPRWLCKVRLLPQFVTASDVQRARIERLAPLLHQRDAARVERDRIQHQMVAAVNGLAQTMPQAPVNDELPADLDLYRLWRLHEDWNHTSVQVLKAEEAIDRELAAADKRGEDTAAVLAAAAALELTPARRTRREDPPPPEDGADPLGADG